MRYDEIRAHVQGMLQDWLKRTIERLDREGPLYKYDSAANHSMVSLLRAGPDDYWELYGPTHRCHILETGNDSFRFKASSAAASAAKEKKETTHSLTPA
jgi:hypothetical protein